MLLSIGGGRLPIVGFGMAYIPPIGLVVWPGGSHHARFCITIGRGKPADNRSARRETPSRQQTGFVILGHVPSVSKKNRRSGQGFGFRSGGLPARVAPTLQGFGDSILWLSAVPRCSADAQKTPPVGAGFLGSGQAMCNRAGFTRPTGLLSGKRQERTWRARYLR
jgi:hypothetical protein